MQHCPTCGHEVKRIGHLYYRCAYCILTSKVYNDSVRFQGKALALARESRGLSIDELAQATSNDAATINRWEDGSPFITDDEVQRLGDALDYPTGFFHMEVSEWSQATTLGVYHDMVWCECGKMLGVVGQPLPLVCATCYAVVEGCPQCDGDLLPRERLGKVVAIACPACKWTRKVL